MNAVIIALFVLAFTIVITLFVNYMKRWKELTDLNARELEYEERWATWAEQTKIAP